MQLLDNYLEARKKLLDYFNYPLHNFTYDVEDYRTAYWCLVVDEIQWGDSLEEFETEDGNYYAEIAKEVYRGHTHTLIVMLINGDKIFGIFDNTREQYDPATD